MIFKDNYFFLSNFYPCNIELELNGKVCKFINSEAAFQAQKNLAIADKFSRIKGLEAKRIGKELNITTPDWDHYRLYAMANALNGKFKNKLLLVQLKSVDEPIVEDNYWHDTFWGVCKGEGKNMLGKMLTFIKDNDNDLQKLYKYIEEVLMKEI